MGHVVLQNGICPNPENVKAILDLKPSKTVKQVRRFLGMVGFYCKFIENYATLAVPLTELTKDSVKFHWSEECKSSFDALKNSPTKSPVLAPPNLQLLFGCIQMLVA